MNRQTLRGRLGNALTAFCAFCMIAASPALHAELEEIVVTAEKRSENVQDVGLSVRAFDEGALDRAGINDVSRIELVVPGVSYAYAGNDAKFNVRGANSTNTFADNSSIVGTYVDGVYKPRSSQQTRAFYDVERLEFLSGPQGTLYGRNTFAGALNLITNAPDLDGFSYGVDLGYERFQNTRAEAFVNLPLSDSLAIRVAGFSEDSEGWIDNNAGPDMGAKDDLGLRFSALLVASDRLDALLRVSYSREQGTEPGLFGYKNICRNVDAQGITDPFGAVRDCQNPQNGSNGGPLGNTDEWEISQDFVPNGELEETSYSLEVNFDAGPVLVKSITSFTDFENLLGFDFDYSPTPFQRGWFDEEADSFSQELQISSTGDGPFQWTGGVYYSEDETFFSFSIFNFTVENNNRPTVVGPGGANFTLLNGTPIVDTATSLGGFFADSTFIDIETIGVYGQGEYSITDDLRLILGLRYNNEEKELFGGGSNFTAGDAPVTTLFNAGDAPTIIPNDPDQVFLINSNAADANAFDESFSNWSWRVGVEYDVNEDMMAYFSAATGFLSGSLNSNGSVTDEQESEMYEVGLKSILMDGTLLFNAAVHYTEYTNLLSQFQVPIGGVVQTFSQNGGEIDAWGMEVEAVYQPTEELQIGFLGSWLDSEFGTFGQVNPYQLLNGQVQGFVDVEGETPGWSPDFTATITAAYDISLGSRGTLTPSVQFYYSDEYNTGNLLSIDPNHDQDSYTKTDVRLTWLSADERIAVEAFLENIEDEAVLARGNNGGDDNVQTGYLYPRNFGVRLKLRTN